MTYILDMLLLFSRFSPKTSCYMHSEPCFINQSSFQLTLSLLAAFSLASSKDILLDLASPFSDAGALSFSLDGSATDELPSISDNEKQCYFNCWERIFIISSTSVITNKIILTAIKTLNKLKSSKKFEMQTFLKTVYKLFNYDLSLLTTLKNNMLKMSANLLSLVNRYLIMSTQEVQSRFNIK